MNNKDKILLAITKKLKHTVIKDETEIEFIEIKVKTTTAQINLKIEGEEI